MRGRMTIAGTVLVLLARYALMCGCGASTAADTEGLPLPPAAGEQGRADRFELQVVVDFYDDLLAGPFTRDSIREMMRIFHEWGITRVYWNGQAYASGLYDAASSAGLDVNALRTYQEIGEFIPFAATCAHAEGMEFFVEFKPFDMYFPMTAPHGVSLFREHNTWRQGIPAIGGAWQMGCIWPEKHTKYLMARNMTGVRSGIEKETIASIKFVKNDDKPTGIALGNLEVYTSRDNHHYARYDRAYDYSDRVEERPVMLQGVNLDSPGRETERVRVITLSGLAITDPYVAVSTQGKPGEPDFANVYHRLVELYNNEGARIPLTYGIPSPDADSWYPPPLLDERFPDRGFSFDKSAVLMANDVLYRMIGTTGYLDPKGGLIAIAKGKNPYITALCPAYPRVRQFWLDQVRYFVDSGADGVEFRVAAHQDTMEWDAYMFNPPIVKEYKKRYGVDILQQPFDVGKCRDLLGEHYTRFLQDAKALLARRGKKMMVDVMPAVTNPAWCQFANVHLDWQTWFSFADGVSFKWVQPNTEADETLRAVANQYRIPTYYNVWQQAVYGEEESLWPKDRIIDHIKLLKAVGHKGFMLYESGALLRVMPDGSMQVTRPKLMAAIVAGVQAANQE